MDIPDSRFHALGSLYTSIILHPATCRIGQRWFEAAMVRSYLSSSSANLPTDFTCRYRFKEPRFLLIIGGTALSCFPLFIPPYFIPIFSRSMGYSNQIAIVILAAWNLASTVGRVLGGYTADHVLGPLNSLVVCLLFIGLSSLVVWPLASSVGIFSVFLIFNGIGCGAFFSLVPPMLGATMGPENTLGILPIVWTTWFFGFFFVSSDLRNSLRSILTGQGYSDSLWYIFTGANKWWGERCHL